MTNDITYDKILEQEHNSRVRANKKLLRNRKSMILVRLPQDHKFYQYTRLGYIHRHRLVIAEYYGRIEATWIVVSKTGNYSSTNPDDYNCYSAKVYSMIKRRDALVKYIDRSTKALSKLKEEIDRLGPGV